MKQKTISALVAILLLSSQIPLVSAQTSSLSDWASVQRIRTNEKVFVKQQNGKEIKGEMIEATDTTLTIDRGGKPFSIPRTDVRQVSVSEGKAQKAKWALIGTGIGAGVGAGIGATKYGSNNEIYLNIGIVVGAGAGALAGLLIGDSRRKRTLVYSKN